MASEGRRVSIAAGGETAKASREESLEKLADIFARCDAITGGRKSSSDSAYLIREAREERHRDIERNCSS